LAGWLFGHPSSVHDKGRIGIGFGLLVLGISGICHVAGARPQPQEGMPKLSASGGLFGWMLGEPLAMLAPAVAFIVMGLLIALSVLIITKTPPNRIGSRLGDLCAWMFEAERTLKAAKDAEAPAAADEGDGSLPWGRRNRTGSEEDPDEGTEVDSQAITKLLNPDG